MSSGLGQFWAGSGKSHPGHTEDSREIPDMTKIYRSRLEFLFIIFIPQTVLLLGFSMLS